MKTLFQFVICLSLLGYVAKAQTVGTVQGFCTTGGQAVKVAGMSSTNTVLASYPRCTVTVYVSGTTTPATIYSDANQTPLSNPFTANADASWVFWATGGGALDVTMSGGTPNAFPQPFTIVAQYPSNAGGGGGGSPPGGATFEVQSNLNGTAFGGSGFFTNSAHSYLYTPAAQWAQYSVNSPLLSYCGQIQCAQAGIYGQNNAILNGSGVATGYGKAYFQFRKNLFTGASAFDGYGNYGAYDPPGGSVIKMQEDNSVFHSSAIAQTYSGTTHAGKDADTAAIYHYLWCHGGYRWGSDEGCTDIRANGGLSYQQQGGFQVSGNPGKGATTLTASLLYNPDDILTTGFIYDFNGTPIASGNVTAYDTTNHILTVTPGSVTPATNEGTTTSAITISNSEQNAAVGVSKTVTVSVTTGTGFTIDNTSPVILACPNPDLEIVVPTAVGTVSGGTQTITANFFHGHPSGCIAAQGGTVGVLDLVADRIGNNWKTSYFVFGATDNSHIYEVTYLSGARGSINPWKHNFGPGFDSHNSVATNVTGTGTTITACNLGQGTYNFGGQYVQLSGYTPSTFNGTYQASAVDKNLCVSMSGAATGTGTGGTISVGGAINSPDGLTQGPGGFKIWQTARIKQIGTTSTTSNGITTNAYNNTFTMYPNDFTAVNGHTIQVLDDMQAKVEPLAAYGFYDVAPTPNLNTWMASQASGQGVTTTSFRMLSVHNLNTLNMYKGGGSTGQLDGARAVSVEGPFAQDFYTQAPVQGGYGVYIDGNANTSNAALNNSFFPFFVAGGGGGGGGFTINYDPNSGFTLITSGTGNGVYTSITMDPLNLSLKAGLTGTFTMQGQNYNFTGLAGAGTRAMTVDSTGKVGTATLGTVTSVGLTGPTWLGISGSPITGAGSIALAPAAFGASGVSHSPGIVPDPGAVAGTTNFLREDSTWANPLSGGISSTFTITTTTGTCNFTYTNGLLTAKTGSC